MGEAAVDSSVTCDKADVVIVPPDGVCFLIALTAVLVTRNGPVKLIPDDLVPALFGCRANGVELVEDAGVIDDHVEPTKLGNYDVDEGLDFGFVCDVGPSNKGAFLIGFTILFRLGEAILVYVVNSNICSSF